ncbi:MAG: erythrose-4-phosphate dehydrogenase [Sinobacterium sp.]|nr:erythrose-4-phosphate dehydrogenase [Sinobacterium sp.]
MSASPKRIAINGFGRIGRCVLRAFLEQPSLHSLFVITAINEIADTATLVHLLKYDSTHGRLNAQAHVELRDGLEYLLIDVAGDTLPAILLTHHDSPSNTQWACDVLFECTGRFATPADAAMYMQNGAAKVLYSQPAYVGVDATIVYGVNHQSLQAKDCIISNASCTTNAVVPVIQEIHRAFHIEAGVITTLHSAMNDQPVIDAYHHTDLRKTRAAINSMIPVRTELAKGIERLLPEMANRFTAHAIRVPTINVSAIDLAITLKHETNAEEVNALLERAAQQLPANVLSVTHEKLASCDFNHDMHSVIVDASQTQVVQGKLVKLLLWFDNEWAYSNRMLDVASLL